MIITGTGFAFQHRRFSKLNHSSASSHCQHSAPWNRGGVAALHRIPKVGTWNWQSFLFHHYDSVRFQMATCFFPVYFHCVIFRSSGQTGHVCGRKHSGICSLANHDIPFGNVSPSYSIANQSKRRLYLSMRSIFAVWVFHSMTSPRMMQFKTLVKKYLSTANTHTMRKRQQLHMWGSYPLLLA